MHGSANDSQNQRPFVHEQSMGAVDPSPHCTTPVHDVQPGAEHAAPLLTTLGGGHMGSGGGSLQAVAVHMKREPSHTHVSL